LKRAKRAASLGTTSRNATPQKGKKRLIAAPQSALLTIQILRTRQHNK
jgi:hypothetical protein